MFFSMVFKFIWYLFLLWRYFLSLFLLIYLVFYYVSTPSHISSPRYKNEFSHLGKTMLDGLKYIRKDIKVEVVQPEYLKPKESVSVDASAGVSAAVAG